MLPCTDEQNLPLTASAQEIDRLNAEFYGRFPYPWRSMRVERILDGNFSRKMLCQAAGDWSHLTIPDPPHIWVAGCGTNQAVNTALAFPDAKVVGSDLSRPSLDICALTAADLQVQNLDLRQESINECCYQEAFDYILCTGVIHHNLNPAEPLRRLSKALKPGGILELMVYNRFHRILTSSFQKAVRIMTSMDTAAEVSSDLHLATSLVNTFPVKCQMREFLASYRHTRREHFADSLMQPVEQSYTVESLLELAQSCGLDLLGPVVNMIDRANGTPNWNLRFGTAELDRRYYALDDIQRWQITNLLLSERSPMLWFYLRRSDCGLSRLSERQICDQFLETRFIQAKTQRVGHVLCAEGTYKQFEAPAVYPGPPNEQALAGLVADAKVPARMRDLLEQHALPCTFPEVNDLRLRLTIPLSPYLQATA